MKYEVTFGVEDVRGFVTHAVEAENRGEAFRKAKYIAERGDVPPQKCSLFGKSTVLGIDPGDWYVARARTKEGLRYFVQDDGFVATSNRAATKLTREQAKRLDMSGYHGAINIVRLVPRNR